jgi:hypothetical protein
MYLVRNTPVSRGDIHTGFSLPRKRSEVVDFYSFKNAELPLSHTAAPVIVQPGSTYKWEVKDSYRITAWILTDEVGVNLRAITQKSGLPYQENFANPTRLLDTYLGCIAYYTDHYTQTNGEWIFAASQLDSVISYYEALNMTDGSSSDQNAEYAEEFGAYVAKGAAVKSAVACFERHTNSTPTTEKDNSGGL